MIIRITIKRGSSFRFTEMSKINPEHHLKVLVSVPPWLQPKMSFRDDGCGPITHQPFRLPSKRPLTKEDTLLSRKRTTMSCKSTTSRALLCARSSHCSAPTTVLIRGRTDKGRERHLVRHGALLAALVAAVRKNNTRAALAGLTWCVTLVFFQVSVSFLHIHIPIFLL